MWIIFAPVIGHVTRRMHSDHSRWW